MITEGFCLYTVQGQSLCVSVGTISPGEKCLRHHRRVGVRGRTEKDWWTDGADLLPKVILQAQGHHRPFQFLHFISCWPPKEGDSPRSCLQAQTYTWYAKQYIYLSVVNPVSDRKGDQIPTWIMTHLSHFPSISDPWTHGWSLRSHVGVISVIQAKEI